MTVTLSQDTQELKGSFKEAWGIAKDGMGKFTSNRKTAVKSAAAKNLNKVSTFFKNSVDRGFQRLAKIQDGADRLNLKIYNGVKKVDRAIGKSIMFVATAPAKILKTTGKVAFMAVYGAYKLIKKGFTLSEEKRKELKEKRDIKIAARKERLATYRAEREKRSMIKQRAKAIKQIEKEKAKELRKVAKLEKRAIRTEKRQKAFENIKNTTGNIFNSIKQAPTKAIIGTAYSYYKTKDFMKISKENAKDFCEKAKNNIDGTRISAMKKGRKAYRSLKEAPEKFGYIVKNKAQDIGHNLTEGFHNKKESAYKKLSSIKDTAHYGLLVGKDKTNATIKAVKQTPAKALNATAYGLAYGLEASKNLGQSIKTGAENLNEKAFDKAQKFDAFMDKGVEKAIGVIKTSPAVAKDFLKKGKDNAITCGKNLRNSVKDGISSGKQGAINTFKSIGNDIKNSDLAKNLKEVKQDAKTSWDLGKMKAQTTRA